MAIKLRGLPFAAALVAIVGFVRLAGPNATPAPPPKEETKKENQANTHPSSTYDSDLERTVRQFFGMERNPDEPLDPSNRWKLPQDERKHVRFVFALLPDPVHTHLGLLFDRSIAAIQLAAQRQGYVFDRAILPWDRAPHFETDLEKRQKQIEEQRIREAYPGLLIFREGLDRRARGQQKGTAEEFLFVMVIGETPTGGVRSLQFRQAVKLAEKIQDSPLPKDHPLLILGPTFSGSLVSLEYALYPDKQRDPVFPHPYVFSGTVTDASSIGWFEKQPAMRLGSFAAFQQNDHYLVQRFVDFVCAQRYGLGEIALLSEDNTVYGASAARAYSAKSDSNLSDRDTRNQSFSCLIDRLKLGSNSAAMPKSSESSKNGVLYLHFPREISFFRSAYQKAMSAQPQQEAATSGKITLPLDLEDTGSDDDTVAPYGGTQTPLSQEAVMLGIASELQKHHVKFIVLFATDPVDQLFLARYLRTAYPEGRVIITVPDLLFSREEDTLLHGVLGLSSYALVPGLGDQLCQQRSSPENDDLLDAHEHNDHLFSSSYTLGVVNAMLGLLSLLDHSPSTDQLSETERQLLPPAPYIEYAGLPRGKSGCSASSFPMAWLTILGRDGFWPVAPLDADPVSRADKDSTLKTTEQALSNPLENRANTPNVWYAAYCLCLLMMLVHAALSWTGSTLDDSESSAQFARSNDRLNAFIVAIGAVVLSVAYIALLCARSPLLAWKGPFFPRLWTVLLWLPLPFFIAVSWWDLAKLRKQRPVAIVFVCFVALISLYLLFFDLPPRSRIYWLPRIAHLSSTVSPVMPFLLLLAGSYWWTWQSLRGVTLVDLRRPRLPQIEDLPPDVYRISDNDADALRETAHPLLIQWRIRIPVLILIPFALTAVDYMHPVQTVEGFAYDIGYSLLLFLVISVFLACLLKLVLTWYACRHILGGLNRTVLRRAFGRMKGISWHSLWNPGGSTLRETYKLLSRALENLNRLKVVLSPSAGSDLDTVINETTAILGTVVAIYKGIHPESQTPPINYCKIEDEAKKANLEDSIRDLKWWERKPAEAERILMKGIEVLQKKMAKTAGLLMKDVLEPMWQKDRSPVVSVDVDLEVKKAEHLKEAKDKPDDSTSGGPLPILRVLAEEYVALIYVNFLITVLLRIRTMVMCAIGLYVFLVLSVNTYSFEPHPVLLTLSVFLIVLLGAAVAFVYTEMHRDPILSRLTDSEPGELGWSFWLKLLSAAAIPVFSLLATQFPEINQLLTSWLRPALEALK